MSAPSGRPLLAVMLPTYNERENIADLVEAILALPLEADIHVLVADDNSPDGTGRWAEERAASDPRVHALVREKRRGRGAGGIDGFKAALALHPDYIVEMDADFSHAPKFIPDLLAAAGRFDLVLGSRFVPGGKDADRGLHRRFITLCVRTFIRRLYRVPVRDVSSGFRLYRREVLEAVDLDDLISVGQSVVLEILRKVSLLGFRIGEVPIVFVDRTRGQTKLNFLALLETLLMAVQFKKRYNRNTVKAVR
ncbi:MAG: polyprenol monophosphomannose synthase [Candidatus Aminicenantes bacterium]|nr:polyprenol monophosphomannose synthase [Candidatus Aminicenantes bacterium]